MTSLFFLRNVLRIGETLGSMQEALAEASSGLAPTMRRSHISDPNGVLDRPGSRGVKRPMCAEDFNLLLEFANKNLRDESIARQDLGANLKNGPAYALRFLLDAVLIVLGKEPSFDAIVELITIPPPCNDVSIVLTRMQDVDLRPYDAASLAALRERLATLQEKYLANPDFTAEVMVKWASMAVVLLEWVIDMVPYLAKLADTTEV